MRTNVNGARHYERLNVVRPESSAGLAGGAGGFETFASTELVPRGEAEAAGTKIVLQLTRGNFAAAHLIIDELARTLGREERPIAAATPLAELVSHRTAAYLEGYFGVLFAGQVVHYTDEELLEIPNFGPVSLRELDAGLARIDLHRRKDQSE
jgi:hypothetical protein